MRYATLALGNLAMDSAGTFPPRDRPVFGSLSLSLSLSLSISLPLTLSPPPPLTLSLSLSL